MNFQTRFSLVALFVLSLAFSCAKTTGSVREASVKMGRAKAAVVSLSVNEFGGMLQGWNTARSGDVIQSQVGEMLKMTETELSKYFEVVPTSSFVGNPQLQSLAVPYEVAVPKSGTTVLPTLAKSRADLVAAKLTAEQIQALTQITGASVLVVIYSEWGARTGGMIPTSKALTKNVVTFYAADGTQIFHGRNDKVGAKTLGAYGLVALNDGTIAQWVDGYQQALSVMFSK